MSRAVTSNLDFQGQARAVGLLDPVSAQDAATRAYVLARAPEDLQANIQVTPGGGTGAGGAYLAADLALLVNSLATSICFDIQADGDVVIAGLPWPSSQPNAGTPAPMRMLTLTKSNPGTTRRIVIPHYSALEATVANRVALPRETSSLVIASRLESRTFRNFAPTNSGGRYWVLLDGMGARENYLDNATGDVAVHDGKEFTKTSLSALLATVPPATGGLFLPTSQVVGSALPLAMALNAATTRYFLTTSGDGDIETITAGTAGRLVLFQSVFGGTKRFRHLLGGAGSTKFICPRSVDCYLGERENALLMCDGANGWLVMPFGDSLPMAAGAQCGRQIDAATGRAVDLTGAEQGQNIRFAFTQVLTLSAGTYNDVEIDVRAKIVEVVPTGDVIITGFKMVLNPLAPGAGGTPGTPRAEGNAGALFSIYKHGFSGRVMLYNYNAGSAALNQIGTPNQVEWMLEHAAAGTLIGYSASYGKFQPVGKPSAQCARNGVGFGGRDITNYVEGTGISIGMSDNTTLKASNVAIAVLPITPTFLSPLASNKAVRFCFHVPYAAGSAGARDVLITSGEAFNLRIVGVTSMVNTPQAASSGQLRSAAAGGGSPLSFSVATTAGATTEETNRAAPNDIAAGTPIYWRLTDGRVAGDIFVDCLRY